MRVVHLIKHGERGNGSVHVAVDLACEQARNGDSVWFFSANGFYDRVLSEHGVRVSNVPEPSGVLAATRSLRQQMRLVRQIRPDVLHAHMMSSAVIGYVLSILTRVPMVTTVHNSFDGHSWLMRLGARVAAVSEAERNLLVSRGFPGGKVVTVKNGTFGSPRMTLASDPSMNAIGFLHRPSVMTLSGLHERKAVDQVIRAFSLLPADVQGWHLNIVGGGPDLDRLRRLTTDLRLDAVVHFLGSTPAPWDSLEQSEIFAHVPTAEPFGLAVAEARQAGCAIVATRVGGIPEVLDGGSAGVLVTAGKPAEIAEVLASWMRDPQALRAAQAAAYAGSERLSVAQMARDYENLYFQVIDRTASERRRERRTDG